MCLRGQAGRPAGPHDRPGPAALHDGRQAFLPLSRADRDDLPLPHRRPDEGYFTADERGGRGPAHRHPQASGEGHSVPRLGPARRGRRAALRGWPQGEAQKNDQSSRCLDPLRHAHPPDPEHGPLRPAGYVHAGAAPRKPPARPDLCDRARLGPAGRRHAPGAGPGRPGLLSPQPHGDHRPDRRKNSFSSGRRGPHRHRPRQAGPGAAGRYYEPDDR